MTPHVSSVWKRRPCARENFSACRALAENDEDFRYSCEVHVADLTLRCKEGSWMRRRLTIVALAAMMLAGIAPAMGQSPNQSRRPPNSQPVIPLSIAQRNIMAVMPTAKVVKIGPLPSGDIIATIRIDNQVRKVRVDGQTGEVEN
jgi:hypothetical protein